MKGDKLSRGSGEVKKDGEKSGERKIVEREELKRGRERERKVVR